MKGAAIWREVWRDTFTGTARAGLFALALTLLVVAMQCADLLTVRELDEQVQSYRAAGADVLVIAADSRIDGAACAALAGLNGVQAAGALRQESDSEAAILPGSRIPSYAVSVGMPAVLHASQTADRTGVVLSEELATALGAATGDELLIDGVQTSVAGVYAYPQDGRAVGYGYALLDPTADLSEPFDQCWVRQWPQNSRVEQMMLAAVLPSTQSDDSSAQLTQLNATLGGSLDAAAQYRERVTRWAPLVTLFGAIGLGLIAVLLRRLEIASARHLGVARRDQVLIQVLTAVGWAIPAALAGALAGAVLIAQADAADVPALLGLAALTPVAAVLGVAIGAATGVLLVRRGSLMRLVKER